MKVMLSVVAGCEITYLKALGPLTEQIDAIEDVSLINEESQLTCISETLFPTIAVSPITTPVP